MRRHGAKFNKNLSAFDLRPIYFIYYFGGKDAAEADFSRSSFWSDTEAKFAFVKGLKILNG